MRVFLSKAMLLTAMIWSATGPIAMAEPARPTYSPVLRQNEDWSVLRSGVTGPADRFDPIKYIPLNADQSIWLSIGGQVRTRVEAWKNFNFDADDDIFLLNRLRLHGDLHVGEHFRIFVEGKNALSTDRDLPGGRRTLDVDTLELQQGFAELRLPLAVETGEAETDVTLRLRAGRQMLLFGKQRLVSPLDWSNTMRAWDGVTATLQTADWNVTGFWTYFAPVRKYEFNKPDDDIEFWGLYATGPLGVLGMNADTYFLTLDRHDASFNGTVGDEQRYTLGGRLFGTIGSTGLDYDAEAAWQFGKLGGDDISAWMFAGEVGYRFAHTPLAPRVHLGFDYASGDRSPGGDVQTFNQLFPLGHAYLGYIDVIGRQNIIDLSAGISVNPTQKLTLALAGHWFWRANENDALYNAGGGVVRLPTDSSRDVGQEIDLTLHYQLDRHWAVLAGYSHFFSGDFIKNTGPGKDIDFGYIQVQLTF